MTEITNNYSELISFLASLFGVAGAIVGLLLFWWSKNQKVDEDSHSYIIEKRSFEINNLKSLSKLDFHADETSISIQKLKSIYNNPKQSVKLKEQYSGTYDQMHKVISLYREKRIGRLQAYAALMFCVFVILIVIYSACAYNPNKAFKMDANSAALHLRPFKSNGARVGACLQSVAVMISVT